MGLKWPFCCLAIILYLPSQFFHTFRDDNFILLSSQTYRISSIILTLRLWYCFRFTEKFEATMRDGNSKKEQQNSRNQKHCNKEWKIPPVCLLVDFDRTIDIAKESIRDHASKSIEISETKGNEKKNNEQKINKEDKTSKKSKKYKVALINCPPSLKMYGNVLNLFYDYFFSSFVRGIIIESFSAFYPDILVGFREFKFTKVWGLLFSTYSIFRP